MNEEDVFHTACEIQSPELREAFLQQVCAGDDDRLSRIRAMLQIHEENHRYLNVPPAKLSPAELPSHPTAAPAVDGPETADPVWTHHASERIGRYKLLQKIGEGGFGIVFMAEQEKPVRRRVALKVIKPGMDTKQVIGRFEAERQALAMLDHPNIAKVFDAGATEHGRPYFVMELVRGEPLTEFCDENRLDTQERLKLFVDVCSAIQHAHQKGIIHRDIKPSNVLVTLHDDRPVPKVIDFGIAKATEQRLTERTVFTEFKQFLGTPAYMSPEQAALSGLDIDTRSDVYSLGVLLYELLSGVPPFDGKLLREMGYEELCRVIRESVPPVPSSRVSTLGKQTTAVTKSRKSDLHGLQTRLRGEVDWIVMKAIEKDRTRRYDTASALAADIDRFLNCEPVLAGPPSMAYRFRKLVERNWATALTTFAIVTSLLVGTVAVTLGMFRAIDATKQSEAIRAQLVIEQTKLTNEVQEKEKATKEALTAQAAAEQSQQIARDARVTAEAEGRRARQTAYLADMLAVDQALRSNNLGLAKRMLNRNRDFETGDDPRHWEWRALWLRCHGDAELVFDNQCESITSVRVSPDGRWMATGEANGRICILNALTGKLETTLVHETPNQHGFVAFSPQGERLYATAGQGVLKSWTIPSFEASNVTFEHGGTIRDIGTSRDGSALVAFGRDEYVTVWDPKLGTRHRFHAGSTGGESHGKVAISVDSSLLGLGVAGQIRIFDLKTLEELRAIPQPGKNGLAFSPDGQMVASADSLTNNIVYVHRVSDGSLLARLQGHALYILALEFSPDGKLLASASADQTVRLWDMETLSGVKALRQHDNEVWALTFAKDRGRLVSGGKNGEICIWDPDERETSQWTTTMSRVVASDKWHRQYSQVSFSPDGELIAIRNPEREISLRSAKNLELIRSLPEAGNQFRGVRFSPTDALLAVGGYDGSLTFIDPDKPEEVTRVVVDAGGEILPAAFSQDGSRLLVVSRGDVHSKCAVYSVHKRALVKSWAIPSDEECASLSPDGELVVTGHTDADLRIWRIGGNESEPKIVSCAGRVLGVDFSPNGGFLIAATGNSVAHIIDVTACKVVGQLTGHMQGCHSVRFSPDGKRVATGGSTFESLKVWDFETRRELMTLNAPGYSFRQVEWSSDGSALLLMGGWQNLSLFRAPTFNEIQEIEDRANHGSHDDRKPPLMKNSERSRRSADVDRHEPRG